MEQFGVNDGVRKAINDYLLAHGIDLKIVVDGESASGEIAAIIHNGPPIVIKKIYPPEKMKTSFWTKKNLMVEFIAMHLATPDKKKPAKTER